MKWDEGWMMKWAEGWGNRDDRDEWVFISSNRA